ncbi:MAG: sulfur carrier protein ThiS [Castellaniella sp.]|uniref:sulfur carrier protein ThiS n=1 Tax=Castellaniella sp. TaxID=1955812 RepID=UPI0011FA244F|nr:sulfur carrier protein ThiS [Castellaniella sp.]TAN30653.1 MAG: sulfur carrier protein ThiS [Castellaniella sp.]
MNPDDTNPTPNIITVHVNGQPLTVPAGSSLLQVLTHLTAGAEEVDSGRIATALNGQHIARGLRDQTLLTQGDHITTFEPITGG